MAGAIVRIARKRWGTKATRNNASTAVTGFLKTCSVHRRGERKIRPMLGATAAKRNGSARASVDLRSHHTNSRLQSGRKLLGHTTSEVAVRSACTNGAIRGGAQDAGSTCPGKCIFPRRCGDTRKMKAESATPVRRQAAPLR